MRKPYLTLFLLSIMIMSTILVSNLNLGRAQNGTQVGGILWDNTTWTTANNPYIITSMINIPSNVTLTIEAGVIINSNFSSQAVMFYNNGTIIVNGTKNNMVVIDGNEYSNFFSSPNAGFINATIELNYCVLKNGYRLFSSIYGTDIIFSNCEFRNIIGHSSIKEGTSLCIKYSAFINSAGFYFNDSTNSTLCNNLFYSKYPYSGNLIVDYGPNPLEIHGNTFINIDGVTLSVSSSGRSSTVNATHNYWGTTDTSTIDLMIYDKNDNLGCSIHIPYQPILTSPDQNTPLCINASTYYGGSISPCGVLVFKFGENQNFKIVPNTGYNIADVFINGSSIGSVSSYYIEAIGGFTNISATFVKNPVITQTPTDNPSSTPSPTPMPTPTVSPSPTPSPTPAPTPDSTDNEQNTASFFSSIEFLIVIVVIVVLVVVVVGVLIWKKF